MRGAVDRYHGIGVRIEDDYAVPKRPVETPFSTSSRMKLLRGVVSLDTDSGGKGLPEHSPGRR